MSCTLKYRFPILYSCLEYLHRKTEYLRPFSRISSRVSDMFQRIKHYIFPRRLANIFPVIAGQCCATRFVHTPARLEFLRSVAETTRAVEPSTDLLTNEKLLRKRCYHEGERNFQTLLQRCIMKRLAARVLHTAFHFYNQR